MRSDFAELIADQSFDYLNLLGLSTILPCHVASCVFRWEVSFRQAMMRLWKALSSVR